MQVIEDIRVVEHDVFRHTNGLVWSKITSLDVFEEYLA